MALNAKALDYRVVASRNEAETWEVDYQVGRHGSGKPKPTIFEATVGREAEITVCYTYGTYFTVLKNGGWRQRLGSIENERYRSYLWDENGDGLFDSLGTSDFNVSIRYGNEIVKVINYHGDVWENATEVGKRDRRRTFVFKNNQFFLKPTQTPAREHAYVYPKSMLIEKRFWNTTDELKSKLDDLSWQDAGPFGPVDSPIKREFAEIHHQEKIIKDGLTLCKFQTIGGVNVSVMIQEKQDREWQFGEDRVTRWQFGDVYSQEFVYGKKDDFYCSKFNVGPFEYSDRDGDGMIDAFYNADADERIEIRSDSLVPLTDVKNANR